MGEREEGSGKEGRTEGMKEGRKGRGGNSTARNMQRILRKQG